MNKDKLIQIVSEEHNITKVEAAKLVDTVFNSIVSSLSKGEEVSIYGFGTFLVRQRKARDGINPATREKIRIAASKSPAFKASKRFKDSVK